MRSGTDSVTTLSEQTITVVNVNKSPEHICCFLPTEICLSGTVPIYKLCAWGDEKSCPDDHGKVYTYSHSASKALGETRYEAGACLWMCLWRHSASKQVGLLRPWICSSICWPEQNRCPRGRRAPWKKSFACALVKVLVDIAMQEVSCQRTLKRFGGQR